MSKNLNHRLSKAKQKLMTEESILRDWKHWMKDIEVSHHNPDAGTTIKCRCGHERILVMNVRNPLVRVGRCWTCGCGYCLNVHTGALITITHFSDKLRQLKIDKGLVDAKPLKWFGACNRVMESIALTLGKRRYRCDGETA